MQRQSRLFASIVIIVVLWVTACGGRPLPGEGDGSPPGTDSGPGTPDACLRPPGGCFSSEDCPAGEECQGCGADPCCPMCAVCYGRCVPREETPGCRNNEDCDEGEYCHIDGACEVTGAKMGLCKATPEECDLDYSPVCGCDGKTYPNACAAQGAGVNVAHQGPCPDQDPACLNVTCSVHNDCCDCKAVKGPPPPICKMSCKQPTCNSFGFKHPLAYCLQGKCFLTDDQLTCSSDADCTLHSDCCSCMALPKGINFPFCPATCYVSQCTSFAASMGIPSLKARCQNGVCKLSAK